MQVTNVMQASAAQAAAAQQSEQKTGTLDYNAFLTLLIAELKNQDPTEPMDSAQYIGQLASFSNVEQSVKLNAKLETLITSQALAQAESLIGRTVTSADGAITGTVTGLRILDSGAAALLDTGVELELGAGVTVTGA